MVSCTAELKISPTHEPEITIPTKLNLRTFRLPLDNYRRDPVDLAVLARARSVLFRRCMQRFGFDRHLPSSISGQSSTGSNEYRYGLASEDNAAKFGYHPAREETRQKRQPPKLSPAEKAVAFGVGQSKYHGRDVPVDGCFGEADRQLAKGAIAPTDPNLVENLSIESSKLAERDSRVRAGFDAWSRCMAQSGYHYRSPWDANDDPAFQTRKSTAHEIATAKADTACKRRTGLLKVWAAVEVAYQRTLISRYHNQLERTRKELTVMLMNARRIT